MQIDATLFFMYICVCIYDTNIYIHGKNTHTHMYIKKYVHMYLYICVDVYLRFYKRLMICFYSQIYMRRYYIYIDTTTYVDLHMKIHMYINTTYVHIIHENIHIHMYMNI